MRKQLAESVLRDLKKLRSTAPKVEAFNDDRKELAVAIKAVQDQVDIARDLYRDVAAL
jgi:hypothetical protein